MSGEIKQSYGLSSHLFISRKASGDSLVLGGIAEDSSRWTRVLSQRAAQMLWFHLTRYLFPDKAETANAMLMTAPIRSTDMPTITTHVTVDLFTEGGYEISGWVNEHAWDIRLGELEAQQFWKALNSALYPAAADQERESQS